MELELCGVKIKISFLFFAVLTLLFGGGVSREIKLALLFSALHEAGHLAALLSVKSKPREIRLGAFGMTIVRGEGFTGYREDFAVALCGPLVNVVFCVFFLVLYRLKGGEGLFALFAVNLAIAAFNLAPVFSLDGGRMLEAALLWAGFGGRTDYILKTVSFFTLVLMMSAGFLVLIKSGCNFTLLLVSVYLTVMLFFKS